MKRPRFSLRMYAIVVTLICAYFVSWKVTERYGTMSLLKPGVVGMSSPAPFVVKIIKQRRDPNKVNRLAPNVAFPVTVTTIEYYLWLVLTSVKIFERQL
jgi:hypothetical protein